MMYKAWMMPGMKPIGHISRWAGMERYGVRNIPRMVKRMLMRKSALQPRSRNTPRGGRKMAKMILMMSLEQNVSSQSVSERAGWGVCITFR